MSRAPIAILRDGLHAHPAVRAWDELPLATGAPTCVEVLRQHSTVGVYRLVGAGPEGSNVIGKCSPPVKVVVELVVYERLLPRLPVTAPRYYGSAPADGPAGDRWMFLEDVGGERYSDSNRAHLAMAARWVARMHGAATGLAAARALPGGGPSRYLEHLTLARDKIRRRLPGPDLEPRDVTLLEAVVALLGSLETRWSRIEERCTGLPATLVHGDFRPKNAYVRANGDGSGLACYPIDWETAGWGVPAADLTRIDVAAYWAAAREWWNDIELSTVQRLADVGQVFRTLAAIDWESASLRFESRRMISRPLASLAVLRPRLADAARTAGLLE